MYQLRKKPDGWYEVISPDSGYDKAAPGIMEQDLDEAKSICSYLNGGMSQALVQVIAEAMAEIAHPTEREPTKNEVMVAAMRGLIAGSVSVGVGGVTLNLSASDCAQHAEDYADALLARFE